nr:hypothetical protein [Nanoarchaeum sp.]
MQLDLKDKKILYQLDLDSRSSANKIAKTVGLSKDAVNYRINNLIKNGIIKNFYTVLNTPQLGFMHFNTLFRFRTISKEIKKKFIDYCINNKRVIWCVSCYGSWDFGVSFLAKNLEDYNLFIQDVLNNFGEEIHEKVVSLIVDSPTYSRDYLINKTAGKEFVYKTSGDNKIDETENKILKLISQNANLNVVQIASKLDLSVDVVRYRINQLIEKNIIQGFRINIDTEKIGYLYYKLLFTLKDLSHDREVQFKEYSKRNPNIIQFIKYIGKWEIQLELEVESESDLFKIIEEIRNNFGDIIQTYEILKLKEEKLNYYPF